MKIRLMGTRGEIDAALPALNEVFEVLETSSWYPNRGDSRLGRAYVEVGGVRARVVRVTATRVDGTAIEGQREIEDGQR